MKLEQKQLIDQTLHFAWSAVAVAPIAILGLNPLSGALTGLAIALPRELIDQWPVHHLGDTLLDIAFFVFGGAAAGAIL